MQLIACILQQGCVVWPPPVLPPNLCIRIHNLVIFKLSSLLHNMDVKVYLKVVSKQFCIKIGRQNYETKFAFFFKSSGNMKFFQNSVIVIPLSLCIWVSTTF